MRKIILTALALTISAGNLAAKPAGLSLFDGKTLTGWNCVGSAEWKIENEVISGGQFGDPGKSGLLMTDKTFKNFDLSLDYKIDEHGKYNSGVYLRHGPGERRQRGYQINIGRGEAEEYVGLHFKEWLDKGDEDDSIRKPLEWNHLRIRAVGAHIESWLNGRKIVDYTDPDPKPEQLAEGTIAFQTYGAEDHAGWVKFRRIRITDLDRKNTAIVPAEQRGAEGRRAEKRKAIAENKFDLLMIGDSITHNFDKPEFKPVWETFFAPRNAISLGYSGGRTENTLWNLLNGELKGQSPKVATLLIGTNNTDDANYPIAHTAEEVFAGTKAIVTLLRERCPDTKILLLRIFPRTNTYTHKDGSPRGDAAKRFATNHRAGELCATLADDKHVFFLDVNHVFSRPDGSLDPKLMPDQLHPSPAGAMVWAEAMEPTLSKLFGDEPKCAPPTNNTLVPLPKIEDDFYDWWKRHEAVLAIKEELDPEIVLIGDSITHLWGGLPGWKGRAAMGPKAFEKAFEGKRVLNLGFGFDRIQNVLWRLDHGEVRGLRPDHVVLNIGTNNLRASQRARGNTAKEIAGGIHAVILRLRTKLPETHITLMGVFPRGENPNDKSRAKITEINSLISKFGEEENITYLDIGDHLLEPDGTITRDTMPDFLHLGEGGYAIWGDTLKAIINR